MNEPLNLKPLDEFRKDTHAKGANSAKTVEPTGFEPELLQWDKPETLPGNLPKVEEFTPQLLPESIKPWVMDISTRMQCPPDYPAVAAMVGLSSVIGRKVGIRPKARDNGFEVVPNLWGVLVGRPSELKTPAMAEALKPLKRLEIEARADYENSVKQHEIESSLASIKSEQDAKNAKAAIKDGKEQLAREILARSHNQESEPPTRKRYVVNDATVEKLGELLNENPTGLLLERDELSGFLKGLEREDRSNDRSFYLEGFNGRSGYTYDRIGRGTIDIPAVTISMIGTIQPGKLTPYVRNAIHQGMSDDGLIQRFQLSVYPDSVTSWRYQDDYASTEAKEAAYDTYKRLDEMEPPEPFEGDDIYFARFSDEAQGLFVEWLTSLETKIREPDIHPAIEAHLAKYRSLAPSIALIIQLAEGESMEVSASAFARSAAWCDYLESHARRIYGMAVDDDTANAKTIIEKVRSGKLSTTFKPRDIRMKKWSGLAEMSRINRALNMLEEYGWVIPKTNQTPGRKASVEYHCNPHIDRGEP